MPLNIGPAGQETPPTPEAPRIYSQTYRHSIVDSKYQPELSLLSQVQGAPRLALWFRQFLQGSEEPKAFSPGNADTYQSYTRIEGIPLKQEGNGAYNFNTETTESSAVYNGWVIAGLNPILHDVFVMDIGDGHAGLFAISEQPEIRNFTANKVYYITYVLLGILTKEWDDILEGRVVGRQVYSKDSALHGGASLITEEEEAIGKKLFQWNQTIANYIMRTFWWNPERTIVFTTSDGKDKVYDPYLVNFLCAMIEPDMRTLYPTINQFSVQYGGLEYARFGTMNIWEVLLRGDLNVLKICKPGAAMIETTRLMNTRLYGNIRSSKIRWFIATNPDDFLTYKVYFNMDGYPILMPGVEQSIPTYLFSAGFYEGKPEGEFENLVYSSLRDKLIDHKRLLAYCEGYFQLEERRQLYEGAILLMLLKASRRLGGFM